MNDLMVVNGQGAPLPTIIGQTAMRFPVGGKIRAGIKVLTKSAGSNPHAKQIYDRGVAAGQDFDSIEKAIAQALPDIKNPLTPRNVPFFTVRRCDFAVPEVADQILELYGEDRGDGVKRLYRFPVVFPADQWQAVMPHGLMCYGSSQLKFWSAYSPDGRDRYCMGFEKVPVDGNGKRTVRLFGGRKHVRREENGGRCDPESCKEYQTKQCNLTGKFIFLMPGIASISAIELATNSFYSMAAAREALETVAVMRGGRISGFLDGKTSFWLCKELKDVPMIGEDGQPRRVPQWLIKLAAPVDLTRLLRVDDDEERIAQADRAANVLNGHGQTQDGQVIDGAAVREPAETAAKQAADADTAADATTEPAQSPAQAQATAPRAPAATPERATEGRGAGPASCSEALGELFARLDVLNIPRDKFERYTRKKYGPGWSGNPQGVKRVRAAVEDYRENVAAFLTKMDNELDVFA